MAEIDARGARCVACGAALSLGLGDRAMCLFCLRQQPLPDYVATPLVRNDALGERLAQLGRELGRYRRRDWGFVALVAFSLPLLAMAASSFVRSAASERSDPLAFVMFTFIGLGGLVPLVAVPGLWLRLRRSTRARILAALPAAAVGADERDQVASRCPTCGAGHDIAGQATTLTATCDHCRTEALLPLPLVERGLARLHAEVITLRQRGEGEVDAAKAAVATWQKVAVPRIFALLALYGVGIVVLVVLAEARAP